MAAVSPFSRVEAFKVTVAAGTAQAAPTSTNMIFNPGDVVGIEIDIPDGHSGLTGLAIATAHQPILPFSVGAWIIGNDDKIEWALYDLPDTGNFQAITFNTDIFVHSFYVRFLISDLHPAVGGGLLAPPLVI